MVAGAVQGYREGADVCNSKTLIHVDVAAWSVDKIIRVLSPVYCCPMLPRGAYFYVAPREGILGDLLDSAADKLQVALSMLS
jgi:hypothetical protein